VEGEESREYGLGCVVCMRYGGLWSWGGLWMRWRRGVERGEGV